VIDWTEEDLDLLSGTYSILTRIIHIAVTWAFFTHKTATMETFTLPWKPRLTLNRAVWERNL